ncbi:MAG: hypothetical protein AAF191_03880, partial [Verrucomicrobiota bacterium]
HSPETGGDGMEESAEVIERITDRGPFQLLVRAFPKEPTIADRVTFVLTVTASEDDEITFPPFGEKLDQFGIVDYETSEPKLVNEGMLEVTRTYELEPFLSGDYVISPMTVEILSAADDKVYEVESEELLLEVRSLLPEEKDSLTLHGIAGPQSLPKTQSFPMAAISIGTAVVLGLLAAGWWWWRRKGTEGASISTRPADEIAFEALESLIAEDLPGKGEIKAFYQRISWILRVYLENRFAIRVPGQTTEEFLEGQRRVDSPLGEHRHLLSEFLRHCDEVKFAEHQPSREEIQKTFDHCKEVILATRMRKEEPSATEEVAA